VTGADPQVSSRTTCAQVRIAGDADITAAMGVERTFVWLCQNRRLSIDYERLIPAHGAVECWLIETKFRDPAHSDFWRASPQAKMFLLRGYEDDSHPDDVAPGSIFDIRLENRRVPASRAAAQYSVS
jgi:hypothetical protein